MKFLIFLSEAMVPLMIFYIVGFGLLSGRPVLDDFIDGAKDGMKTVAGILPTLVGLLVSVGVLRASGFLDFLGELLQMPAALLHIPPKLCLWSWCVWYPTQQPQGWCWTYLRSTEQTPRLDLLHPYS